MSFRKDMTILTASAFSVNRKGNDVQLRSLGF